MAAVEGWEENVEKVGDMMKEAVRGEEREVKVENFWGTAVYNMATGTEEDVMVFGEAVFRVQSTNPGSGEII